MSAGARKRALQLGTSGGDILPGEETGDVLAQHLRFRPAQDVLGAGVPAGDPALQVDGDDRVVDDAVEDLSVARLALRHGLSGTVRRGGVESLAEDPAHLSIRIVDRLVDEIDEA